jgi:hypothetical protein
MNTDWSEVVTIALLGTDRRPLPPELLLPPGAEGVADAGGTTLLLDDAVRHRALRRAARLLARCPAPPVAPDDDRPWAPPAAQDLLGRLLARPVPELVNAWLGAAAAWGVRPAPEHWTDLAALAATRPDYDRGVLAQALGVQGVWFVAQNPAWRRLSEALARPTSGPARGGGEPARPVPGEVEVRGRPELALEVPAPWPRTLTVAALRVLLSGQLGWQSSRYGSAVGARLAEEDRDLLWQALDALPDGSGRPMPGVRLVQEALQAASTAADDRAAVDVAFDLPTEPDSAGAPENQEHR